MFSKYGVSLTKGLIKRTNVQLLRVLHIDHASQLRNPGSEPLTIATFGDVIAETVNKYPERVAIRSIHEDVTLTYEELLRKADSLGCALRANGYEKGDRLGIWAHNCSAWVISTLAAARVGLISVLINPLYEKDELRFCINKLRIKGLLIGEKIRNRDYYDIVNAVVPELPTSKEGFLQSKNCPSLRHVITAGKQKLNGVDSLESFINNYANKSDVSNYSKEITPNDGICILMTSGTTGEPKGAMDSHVGMVNNTYFTGKRLCMKEDHQIICLQAPLFHALGSVVTLFAGLRHGSTVVVPAPMYNVNANLHALVSEKCTIITGTPTMYVDMLSNKSFDMSTRLRVALAAGAPCSPQLIRQMNEKFNVESVGALYGLTETTACVFQSMPYDSVDVVAETVGYVADHVEVKVVDDSGKIVPFGSEGELMVRGYCNMLGYWDEPEKTRKTLQEDGWLNTGDKFRISPDGYGTIVGRIKDIVVRGGENIAPKEIEDLLNTHPDVIESQVIGVPDERLGEELCAVVRTRENTTFTIKNVANHCNGKIARFKIPRTLKIIEDFPKTGSGKIQKYKLKELIESGKI